jgi:hypothetical protein
VRVPIELSTDNDTHRKLVRVSSMLGSNHAGERDAAAFAQLKPATACSGFLAASGGMSQGWVR